MGFSEKAQLEGAFDSDTNNNNRKWVIAGIALRAPLKPIYTIPMEKEQKEEVETEDCSSSTTPTNVESKIPTPFTCPPAPRKRKPASKKCNYRRGGGVVREFFTPPDLETVFIRHVEKAI
ncbi:hypothetical protein AAZX31_18G131700 [Glycine max]|uniref:Cyclin-dependent protein kinase inhibitor SMR6 n=2 Tax=Glycine subgen. Soja TaxID=1462606 RepID=I1N1K3_SOYBN|nr:cyclin-dependent protein kinase inhibitor SMR6 [Glycine max]XP_028212754.1 cyclin-dependent protein kinase inhibitor SMR6-like [Glycine soja]KAG4921395.1 hypothetical protein JHK86_050208 [Glycine max]KAG4924510.1 hypothetical protein JHK87_050050 [Glycine soja]KAG4936082.1 hypothetical protein JHK85_051001 [Glycine max]KAG5091586.1 hypothetical protein JHK82_050364 [Glycine max]KAG5094681.1 hypothetical protein JHK84_050269 [Glycine max]|eukprot:XP_003552039.1 cyclin-dependent protein kinase inhibitor SMR6 [Glycine max]